MTRQLRLYPRIQVRGKSFKGCKVHVVPDQSMTLADILKRFIRKESLPVAKEGFYAEDLGDIEKMQRDDLSVIHERTAEARDKLRDAEASEAAKKKAEDDAKAKAEFDLAVSKAVESRLSNAPPASGA